MVRYAMDFYPILQAADVDPRLKVAHGFSFALGIGGRLAELYERDPRRGDPAGACAYLDQAIETGAVYYISFLSERPRRAVDRYDIAPGMSWEDGWRWIARDGNGVAYLFERFPHATGRGAALTLHAPGRCARFPLHAPSLRKGNPLAIDFSGDFIGRGLRAERIKRGDFLDREQPLLCSVDTASASCAIHHSGGVYA